MAVHDFRDDELTPFSLNRHRRRTAPKPLPPLLEEVATLTAPDRRVDLRVTRVLNTSSIHDDHLDRFPDDADAFTSNQSVVDRWLTGNFSTVKGGVITGMVLDEEASLWTVTGRSAAGERVEAQHALLAVAKTLACLRMAGY